MNDRSDESGNGRCDCAVSYDRCDRGREEAKQNLNKTIMSERNRYSSAP